MIKKSGLFAYWFTFNDQPCGPIGFGVTAFSLEDAFSIMEGLGYTFHRGAEMKVTEISSTTQLDQRNVVSNMGPIVLRGIWYPNLNIGFGASGEKNVDP